MRLSARSAFFLSACVSAPAFSPAETTPALHVLAGDQNAPAFINYAVGTELLWANGYFGQGVVIANVEAGHLWSGHEVFDRTALGISATPALQINATPSPSTPELGEVDFHATMVAHVLAGAKTVVDPLTSDVSLTYAGAGMAPKATLWSGAIATHFDKTVANAGSFDVSESSFRTPYVAFFTGTLGGRADVINSSWGFSDPSQQADETRVLSGLAAHNPSVAAVFSAGNSGYGVDQVGGPASSPNGFTVGSLGGADLLTPSSFSSGGPIAFYNPATAALIPAARAAVHLAAPGENFALAAYLQPTGGLEPLLSAQTISSANDLYFTFNQSGTSFSAPVVSGGLALLKSLARAQFAQPVGAPNERLEAALDTRVLRSLTMATALRTTGWNNGQTLAPGGFLLTTQALDYSTGAGAFDVSRAAQVYVLGTADVPGTGGGTNLAPSGWDRGSVTLGANTDYTIDLSAVLSPSELVVALNWFAADHFDVSGGVSYGSFADLDLEVWSLNTGGAFDTLVAASRTDYNTSEFLRFTVAPGGRYGLRVHFDRFVYNLDNTLLTTPTLYGLAWATSAIPEPASFALFLGLCAIGGAGSRRRRHMITVRRG
ncbi:MAG: hypothetical protein RLZZ50_620 [Verrucomicrobiota bacterium]